MSAPELSVVVPVLDERENVAPLVDEIVAALRGIVSFEIVYVDDGSGDGTREALEAAMARVPELRVLVHARRCGQSRAIRDGIAAARAPWIATLDGDGQNDPADLAMLLAHRDAGDARTKLYAGWRTTRRDPFVKRASSRVANAWRRRMLRDESPDTGCGIKLFERAAFLELPYFDHMHRFLPALFRRDGWSVVSVPVSHRHRTRGASKYGTWDRLVAGLADLRGVAWLVRRAGERSDTEELAR